MYRLKAHYGGYAVPWRCMDEWPKKRELLGYGGWMNLYGVVVDEQTKNFNEYVTVMEKNESDLMKQIEYDLEK